MSWNDMRSETLTMEQVAAALSDTWFQKVKRHFRDHKIERDPSPMECVTMYYLTAKKKSRKEKSAPLFEQPPK